MLGNCTECERKKQALSGVDRRNHSLESHRFQQYCWNECQVGKRMRELGDRLLGDEKVEKTKPRSNGVTITVEQYIELKREDLTDKAIVEKYKMSYNSLYKRKRRWRSRYQQAADTD
ncbi:zinc-finger domain-containing protein [Aneurinibacillus thermoaerophilus]|nr:zinc-finger domain-containing protein [Aneurinibacillus thermoaerophilus]MED0681339.1 zinc-finger domain-containing protein [Aneurinibacillus thermoaerophilus]MED0766199.1 zinc-finger domain-containing protein [Aneurinibacillus thermoaerophilus]